MLMLLDPEIIYTFATQSCKLFYGLRTSFFYLHTSWLPLILAVSAHFIKLISYVTSFNNKNPFSTSSNLISEMLAIGQRQKF